ncbi:MAG: EamA family transporter [Saprospiraceae bacterium]|mgnify:CR=1 FL=1|nr:EamA family transporter [Saprospiraceae bacterium]
MGTERKAYFALALVCLVWGVSWVGTKEAVRYMPPFQMVGIRQILAGSAYCLYFILRGATLPRKKEWYPILFLSLLNFVISNGLATWGVKLTTAGLSAIMGAIFPLWLVVILAARGKNKIPPLAWIGILVGFSGVCIVFYEHLHELFNVSFLGGITLGLIASLAWAYGTIYTKEFALDFNPYHSIGWQMLISGFVLTIVAQISGEVIPLREIKLYTWSAIFFLVVVSSIIAFLAYLYALQKLPTGIVSVYAYINPIVAVLAGSLFTGEPLTILIITGSLVTLAGVYIVNRALHKKSEGAIPQTDV